MSNEARKVQTDKRLGYSVLFGLLTLAGVAALLTAPGDLVGAWGFASAVVAAIVLIVVLHFV